ncbi:hypothetical protein RUND412_000928 [Rhizina undulata]
MSLSQSTTLPPASFPPQKWIPPHRRTSGSVPNLPPPMLSESGNLGLYTRAELTFVFGDENEGTFSRDRTDPGKLARILVFDHQHPNFPPELFVKSHLDLVLDVPLEELQKSEVPVFFESGKRGKKGRWIFNGWWKVEKVTKLERWSQELIEYVEMKWGKLDSVHRGSAERTSSQWNMSLGIDWAVVRIVKVRDGDDPVKRWFERFELKRVNAVTEKDEIPVSTIKRTPTPPFTNVHHPSSSSLTPPTLKTSISKYQLPPTPSELDRQLEESIVSIGTMGIDSASEFDGEDAVISRSEAEMDEGEWDKLSVTTEGGVIVPSMPVKADGGGAWTVLYAEQDEVV